MNPNIAQVGIATRFKPGHVAHPGGGRPKRKPFTRALELALKTRIPENEKGKLKHLAGRRLVTAAVVGVLRRAAEGDPAAFKEIKTTIQGPDEQAVSVTHRYVAEIPAPLTEAEWFEQNAIDAQLVTLPGDQD